MNARKELQILGIMAVVFAGFYFLPLGHPRFDGAVQEALALTKCYAREHVILCLLPAFWIAGAIGAATVSKFSRVGGFMKVHCISVKRLARRHLSGGCW